MNTKMSYRELLDIVLNLLYKLKFQRGGRFYSVSDIVNSLNYPLDLTDIIEVGKYLEAQGYIKAEYVFGDVFAGITSSGIVHIEERLEETPKTDEFSNLIEKISEYDENSILRFRKPLYRLIDKMKTILKNKKRGKTDVGKDVDILKLELTKINPDMEIIEQKILNIERETDKTHYRLRIIAVQSA